MSTGSSVETSMSEQKEEKTATEKAGGRKAMAFYATLACCFALALLDKAHTEVLGLIDTLFLVYAGSNVLSKRTPKAQDKPNETTPKPTLEKP